MIVLKFIQLYIELLFLCLIQKVQANIDQKQCQIVLLKQNEKYCELREINTFFVGQSSDNLTNINTQQNYEDLIELSNGPIVYSKDDIIISIKFRELIDENEICSLIYNPQLNTYSINCISTQPTYIIDSHLMILINTQFNILIQTEQNYKCSQFNYNIEGMIVFCYSSDQFKLYQLQKEQEQFKQIIIYQSENLNLSCLLKFHSFSNVFFIIYYQCQGWIINIYENNSFKLQIDQNLLREKYNIEGILLDILMCQTNIYILLSSGGYFYYKEQFIQYFEAENLNLNQILYEFDRYCYLKFAIKSQSKKAFRFSLSKQFQDLILNTKEFPKQIFQISNPSSIFLKYETNVMFYVNQFVYQTIKINIQHLIQLQNQNQRIYIGIDETNQIKLFQIKYSKPCLPYYDENQKYSQYYLSFMNTQNPHYNETNFIECYKPIIIENDELKKEYAILINIENQNQYIERINYDESFSINFLTSSIQSIQPYKISFQSSLNQIKFQLKNNEVKCRFNNQLKNYKGKFIIKTKDDLIYSIIFQGSQNYIKEYHCQSQQIFIYQNLLHLNEQLLLKFYHQNHLILLDQQKQCLYKIQLDQENINEMMSKIMCLDSQIEKIFGLNNQIILKLKDQLVFYNMFSNLGQVTMEQNYILSQIKNWNFEDIFQINPQFYGVLYKNQLHLIYKQVTVQIINITANIIGFITNSQSNLLTCLVLIDIKKNELQFYIVSITEFIQIRNYNLDNYIPNQPLQFKIMESKIIISCQHKINKRVYILIFNCAFNSTLHLIQKIIETNNQFFWVQKYHLYYFDDKNELAVYDLLRINLEIQYLEFNNKISQEIIIQLAIELENIEIPILKKDLMITLINPAILKLIQTNSNILINNQELNFRNYILGQIDNIVLNSNNHFKLRYPLEKEIFQQCSYYCNKFCYQVNNSEYMIFFQFGLYQQTYLVYNYENYIYNLLFVEFIKEDLFLFINQINNQTILISLVLIKDNFFIIKKQLYTQIFKNLQNIVLVQNILIIQTIQVDYKFFINEFDINYMDITNLDKQGQIYYITSYMYLELMVDSFQKIISIILFDIFNSQLRIYRKFEISIMDMSIKNLFIQQGYSILSDSIQIIKQNYNQNKNQLDLMFFIISKQIYDVQFLIRLYLNEQKYEFINYKILRYPKSIQSCKYILITEEDIILECGITRYFYDMQNSDLLCDPIYSSKILDQMEILNSTHYLYKNYFINNQSVVIYVGKRGGYSLQKLSQDNTESISLQFQAISINQMGKNQITLNLQVIQNSIQQNEFSSLRVVILLMIFMIFLAIIIILYRQRKQKQFNKVIKTEISLSRINLNIQSKI